MCFLLFTQVKVCLYTLLQTAYWELSLCCENTQTCMKSKLPKVFCERRLCSHLTFHHTWVQWTQASTHGNKYDRNLRGKATQKPWVCCTLLTPVGQLSSLINSPSKRISEVRYRRASVVEFKSLLIRFYDQLLILHFFTLTPRKDVMEQSKQHWWHALVYSVASVWELHRGDFEVLRQVGH